MENNHIRFFICFSSLLFAKVSTALAYNTVCRNITGGPLTHPKISSTFIFTRNLEDFYRDGYDFAFPVALLGLDYTFFLILSTP
jgi:hypothetical protein